MKSKFVFGLLVAMVVLALAPSSFAQINIQLFGAPSASEVATVKTAQTADPLSSGAGLTVSGSVIANIELTTTRLDISFGGPITSNCNPGSGGPGPASCVGGVAVPAGDPIAIAGSAGLFTGAYISTILMSTGVVQVALPECKGLCATPPGGVAMASGSFRLVGVRLDVNGRTGPITASSALANTANGYINTSTPQTVISALAPGIASQVIGPRSSTTATATCPVGGCGTATAFTNAAISDPLASVTLTEGSASAWRGLAHPGVLTGTAATTTGQNAYQIRLTVAGMPTGMTLSVTSAQSGTLAGLGFSGTTFSSTTTTRTITIPPGTSLAAVETIQLDFTLGIGTATSPLTAGAITLTSTMFPVGNPTTILGVAADGYPVFTQADVGPLTIANIVAASTDLLVPFAVRDGAFDTGISLANTTADPFGGPANGGAATGSGALTLSFYPRAATGGAGTSFALTTSATVRPGIGLSADGTLAAGATWTALLSELLTAAGQTGSFTGYIFIHTNFTNAHGAPFVSDFRNFTSSAPMLVLPPPITLLPGGRSAFAEGLNN